MQTAVARSRIVRMCVAEKKTWSRERTFLPQCTVMQRGLRPACGEQKPWSATTRPTNCSHVDLRCGRKAIEVLWQASKPIALEGEQLHSAPMNRRVKLGQVRQAIVVQPKGAQRQPAQLVRQFCEKVVVELSSKESDDVGCVFSSND